MTGTGESTSEPAGLVPPGSPTAAVPDGPTARRYFRLLWAGQSVSLVGDQFMVLALPLLAVSVLGVSAAQAALLPFALFIPFLLIGLQAGAVVDRLRRRNTLLVSDTIQAAAFLTIAGLAAVDRLPFAGLLVLVCIAGTATVFFHVAYTSYLPQLFTDERELHRGNSRLFLSDSLSRTLGPMVAGPVIAFVGVVAAVTLNALTFVVSVLSLAAIRHREPVATGSPRTKGWMRRDVREGLAFVFNHPQLEPVVFCGAVYVLFLSVVDASLVLYCRDVLELSTVGIGLVLGAAAAGFPIGNLVSGPMIDRFGMARTLVAGATVSVTGLVLMPVAGSVGSVTGLVVGSIVHCIGEGTFGPTSLTLRQTRSPAELLSRVNSVQRFLIWGMTPLGSLLAAGTIALYGLGAAVWLGGIGTALCLPVLIRRGIRRELGRRGGQEIRPAA
jgi:MFS family permease